jgi:uncharacterized protein (TIGR02611 family)
MALAGEPGHEHEHERWDRLREAAIEAEFETGRHEDTVEEARASIHIRLARMTVGSLVLFAGVLMLALPGPGWLAIAGGLAILSKDVGWAERALERVRRRLPADEDGSVSTPVIVLSVLLALGAASLSIWWYILR